MSHGNLLSQSPKARKDNPNDIMKSMLNSISRYLGASLTMLAMLGVGTGVTVYLLLFGFRFLPIALLSSIGVGMAYTLVMGGVQSLTGRILRRNIPLTSKRAVLAHVALQSAAMVTSFFAVTFLLRGLFNVGFTGNAQTMVFIGMIALSASILGNAVYYLDVFYNRLRVAEQAALNAQLSALRARINPHFLFNSLNSIAALIRTRPEEAEHVTESLADLFRYSLRASERPTVRLAEEIESIEIYLEIERARFRDRLQVEINVPESLRRARVPSLLLQPLVENSVKHGAGQMEGRCEIRVLAGERDGFLHVRVEDNGPGFGHADAASLMSAGSGLANIHNRLLHHYGESGTVRIEGHAVELAFPYSEKEEG